MKTVFIALPMRDRWREEIEKDIEAAKSYLCNELFEYEHVECVYCFDSETGSYPWDESQKVDELKTDVLHLGQAIKKLSRCNVCYFSRGWMCSEECRIIFEICREYDIDIITQDTPRR